MKVLSLFDGMSCGMIALQRAVITVDKYYASEIDKYAEKISQSNYPEIIRLGDITKWREWEIEQPDIIIAGSPCQGFSFAGKGLNFNDPRSALFFTFIDILKHYKPKYFLLENVKMKAEHNDVISSILGEIYPERVFQTDIFRSGRLEPILINSALVSAQNRERLYWCNWEVFQPEDKNIFLKDIIETPGIGAIKNIGEISEHKEKSQCIDANYYKGINNHGQRTLIVTGGAFRGRNIDNPLSRESGLDTVQMLEPRIDGKTNTLTTVQKDNVCIMISSADINGNDSIKRVNSPEGKAPCLTAIQKNNQEPKVSTNLIAWRKLTVTECERLQTVPDGYTKSVSNSRAYHALGNGWTVDVIVHILKCINNPLA